MDSSNGHSGPDILAYHAESLQRIRDHAPSYISLKNYRQFTASTSCEIGYFSTINDARTLLWSSSEMEEAVEYSAQSCKVLATWVRDQGFEIIDLCTKNSRSTIGGLENYTRLEYVVERGTNRVSDIWKEVWERSRFLLTGKRDVPNELWTLCGKLGAEAMVLRSLIESEEHFHERIRDVLFA